MDAKLLRDRARVSLAGKWAIAIAVAAVACLNPNSLEVLTGCKVEASLKNAKAGDSFQFMRLGYFCPDNKDSSPDHLVFNRSVSLKDSFKPGK